MNRSGFAKRSVLIAGSAVGIVLASAQLSEAQTSASPPSPAGAPAASDSGAVVVTARRRSENVQRVPESLTAVSGDALKRAGVLTTTNLGSVTPGLSMPTQSGTYLEPNIRGIGSTNPSSGDESNVALYVDGVYGPDLWANGARLNDISQVQILRGPQGTLFGRNATGGAIIITTRDPSQNFGGVATVGYGSFNQRTADLYVTGGITSKISANLAAWGVQDDGFIKDIGRNTELGADQEAGARLKVLTQVTDNTTLMLGASSASENFFGGGLRWREPVPGKRRFQVTPKIS